MVGPWPLAPLQYYLQHMYPKYFNASGVKTGVLHSPPPSIALSLVLLQNLNKMLHWNRLSVPQN